MSSIFYFVVVITTLFAGIFDAIYFKDLKGKHAMAKTNTPKPIDSV